jgi:actin-related protein
VKVRLLYFHVKFYKTKSSAQVPKKDNFVSIFNKPTSKLLLNPFERGIFQNIQDMSELWSHIFKNELKVNPEEHPIVMNEDIGSTPSMREGTTQVMFEKFCVPSLFMEHSSVFSMFSTGKSVGTIVNIGHTKTDVSCVVDGMVLPYAERSFLGGRDLTIFLQQFLQKRDEITSVVGFKTLAEQQILRDVKEKLCFVSLNKENYYYTMETYEYPDGAVISLNEECHLVPEIIFNPSLMNQNNEFPLHDIVSRCISRNSQFTNELLNNIVVCGSGGRFRGLSERLHKELSFLHPNQQINVISARSMAFSEWCGASMMSSNPAFENKWISKQQYDEVGLNVVKMDYVDAVHRTCDPVSNKTFLGMIESLILIDFHFHFE